MTNLDLLEAMNGIREDALLQTRQFLENKEEHKVRKIKKVWRTVLIAALLTSLFTVTAYAVTQFTMSGHKPAEKSFTVQYGTISHEVPTEYVFEFEGPAECREVQFKTNWTPEPDYWGFVGPEENGWASLLEANEIYTEEYQVYQPACVIDVMYAPQFVDGGAMILLGFQPGKITKETWGEVEVYQFEAKATHAIDREQTEFPTGNFVILFHPEEGWIIGVRGYDSMENMLGIARGLIVEPTGRTVHKTDFESKYDFCDIYIG